MNLNDLTKEELIAKVEELQETITFLSPSALEDCVIYARPYDQHSPMFRADKKTGLITCHLFGYKIIPKEWPHQEIQERRD